MEPKSPLLLLPSSLRHHNAQKIDDWNGEKERKKPFGFMDEG